MAVSHEEESRADAPKRQVKFSDFCATKDESGDDLREWRAVQLPDGTWFSVEPRSDGSGLCVAYHDREDPREYLGRWDEWEGTANEIAEYPGLEPLDALALYHALYSGGNDGSGQ